MEETVQKLSPYRWVILVAGCLITFLANYMQYQISAWGVTVMDMLGTDAAGLTNLMMLSFLTAVFLSLPCGSLADKFGAKKVVTVCLAISVVGAFLRAMFLTSMPMQILSNFMTGCGIAAMNANLQKVYGAWFGDQASIAMGIFSAAATIGVVVAQAASTLFPTIFISYLVAAIAQAVVIVFWIFFVKDTPEGYVEEELEDEAEDSSATKVVFRDKNVWILGLTFGLSLATTTAYATLLPSALTIVRGVDTNLAGIMAAVLSVGSFAACIIGPSICVKTGSFKPYLVITTILGGVAMIANWFAPLGPIMWVMLVLNGFFSAMSGPIYDSIIPTLPEIGVKYAGTAGGLYATIGLVISYFLPIVISAVAGNDWLINLTVESALFLVAVPLVLMLPETGPKAQEKLSSAKDDEA